jgi:serine-type D-Ala-D-Ala carboxypeptidase/endopeptidase (penicillin-binding protein 4)
MRVTLLATGLALSACSLQPRVAPVPLPMVTYADVQRTVDSLVHDSAWSRAQWGVLIVDATSGDTVAVHAPRTLLVPASNQKLLTAAVALTVLGKDFQFTTTLATDAPVRDSVLEGDLIVMGTGDPSVTTAIRSDPRAVLEGLADSLRARGIARIRGTLRPGPAHFTDAPLGMGWEWDDLGAGYASSVGDLMYENGYAGASIMVGSHAVVRPSSSSHARYLEAFANVLVARGMLDSGAIATSRSGTVPADTLVRFASPPLAELLPYFLKPSQNQTGEILLKTLGHIVTGAGRADSGSAAMQRHLAQWGVAADATVIRDGSGLTRHNLVSPDALARVLLAMHRAPEAALFRASLPVAGVDGTLERRLGGTAAAGNLRGKSGSLSRVRALSGYLTDASGRELVMVLIVNNFTATATAAEQALDQIAARTASARGRR